LEPRIAFLAAKKLIGQKKTMRFADNKTGELWSSFMPQRKEIVEVLSADLFSLQVFDAGFFEQFDPNRLFTKWALVEVSQFGHVPADMETFVLPAGQYAVFIHHGDSSEFAKTFGFIFTQWLPSSNYVLDDRPHFEILGSKYKHNQPDSEEEVWIPVREKG
jgi:AraC family transcriptional regulator